MARKRYSVQHPFRGDDSNILACYEYKSSRLLLAVFQERIHSVLRGVVLAELIEHELAAPLITAVVHRMLRRRRRDRKWSSCGVRLGEWSCGVRLGRWSCAEQNLTHAREALALLVLHTEQTRSAIENEIALCERFKLLCTTVLYTVYTILQYQQTKVPVYECLSVQRHSSCELTNKVLTQFERTLWVIAQQEKSQSHECS